MSMGKHISQLGGESTRTVDAPFNAANFSGSGALTWTVDLADQITFTYAISGAWMDVDLRILNTTIGGVLAGNNPRVLIPEGRTVAREVAIPFLCSPGGGATEGAIAFMGLGSTFILLQRYSANWIAGANNTDVNGALRFRIS